MGILDYYIQPMLLEMHDLKRVEKVRSKHFEKLTKNKRRKQVRQCAHTEVEYEKWVHKGRKLGVADSFHYKEVCKLCGSRRSVPRTKEVFDQVKNQKWHYKKRNKKLSTLDSYYTVVLYWLCH